MNASVVVSIISAIIAAASAFVAWRALSENQKSSRRTTELQEEQNRLHEEQNRLQQEQTRLSSILAKYEVQEHSERRVAKMRADVRVYFLHVGNRSKVVVRNQGQGEARQVTFQLRDQNGKDPVVESRTTPMPIKSILPGASVEFLATYAMSDLPPWSCIVEWVDEEGVAHSRETEITPQSHL